VFVGIVLLQREWMAISLIVGSWECRILEQVWRDRGDSGSGQLPCQRGYCALQPAGAGYKQIRRLEVIEAIPKSPSGKILRRILRDAAAAQADPPAG
jgi:acyl-CoA synthetase (AMP-forming)/AMP-acid ligase II